MPEAFSFGSLHASFSGRSCFVTGHTGFKGSWLALWLARLGARVSGYSLAPTTNPNNFEASAVREVLEQHVEADLCDTAALRGALHRSEPDMVFHLAAQPLVRASYADPVETFRVNVLGTATLLDEIRKIGKPCAVVVITTDKCYENREHVWGYRESDALGGHDPYSASKGAAEIAAHSFRRSFFEPKSGTCAIRMATARAGNVIGGGDWSADRIVTDVVRCLRNRETISLRSPRAVRPWQHVLEPLSGYLQLAASLMGSDDVRIRNGWNFGPMPGSELPVGQLVELFIKHWGDGCWRDVSDPNQPHEAGLLRLCIDKAIWELDWRPRWEVDEAVARTVRWFQQFDTDADMRSVCHRDIDAYEQAWFGGVASRPLERAA